MRCKEFQIPQRGISEKMIVAQLVREFSAFYETQWYITVFPRTRPEPEKYSL
jgi:hypothetical protein